MNFNHKSFLLHVGDKGSTKRNNQNNRINLIVINSNSANIMISNGVLDCLTANSRRMTTKLKSADIHYSSNNFNIVYYIQQ